MLNMTLSISITNTTKMRMVCNLDVICKSHFLNTGEHVPICSNLENVGWKWIFRIVIVTTLFLNSAKNKPIIFFFFGLNCFKMRVVLRRQDSIFYYLFCFIGFFLGGGVGIKSAFLYFQNHVSTSYIVSYVF